MTLCLGSARQCQTNNRFDEGENGLTKTDKKKETFKLRKKTMSSGSDDH